jgi:hypothetical protein
LLNRFWSGTASAEAETDATNMVVSGAKSKPPRQILINPGYFAARIAASSAI